MAEHEKDEKYELKKVVAGSSQDDDDFVMPESDGIVSGHSLGDKSQTAPGPDHFSPEGFNKRMLATTGSQPARHSGHAELLQGGGSTAGITIKTKLIASLALLTMIIIVVGAVAYSSMGTINAISLTIAKNYAALAKMSEEMKESVYKIRDAEKDFLLLEEQESLDRVTRYTARLRDQVENATTIAKKIEESSGIVIGSQFQELVNTTDEYEGLFVGQVKSIKKARDDINRNISNITGFKKKILLEVTANRLLSKNIIDDYWFTINNKKETGQAQKEEEITFGVMLNKIDKELANMEIQVSKYLDNDKKSFADAARFFLSSALQMIDQAKRRTANEKVKNTLGQLGQNLLLYQGVLEETIDNSGQVNVAKTTIDQQISEQKEDLLQAGEKLINKATEVSDNTWAIIATESTRLQNVSSRSQMILLVVVICGTLLGTLVLIFVPRPILTAINQLLVGSRAVAGGDLSRKVEVSSKDELGMLGASFEVMRLNLVSLVDRIQLASTQISTTLNEIQTAANQQASAAAEQSSSLNEFSSTMAEIRQTADTLSEIAEQVNIDTGQTAEQVQAGNSNSAQVLDSMNTISSSTLQTAERIKNLNDQMDAIDEAVSLISGVADQTTLLSLNAAIEANKAGEMGKGFSVVASEIRRLSDRSIDSASGISGMVRDIQRATESSVVAMDKSSEEIRIGIDRVRESVDTLDLINKAVNNLQQQVRDISSSAQMQAGSSRQVQQSVGEMLSSSRIASQAAQQTSAATYELGAMANQLRDAVAQFKVS